MSRQSQNEPKTPRGSIVNCGNRWKVAVPTSRDPTSGKLVYHRATVKGLKRDAEAYREQILASVLPEHIAPLKRPRRPSSGSANRPGMFVTPEVSKALQYG